jgi:hypothetical protein
MHYCLGDPDYPSLVALNQRAKGLLISLASPLEELGFVSLGAQCSTQQG